MTPLKVLISETQNPWFNLATEDWIFREMDPNVQTLFLWRNRETVVIGRNQNPWAECNLTRMEDDDVFLARRTSGGGAVFHDLGNTCFTFLSPQKSYDRRANVAILLAALQQFGIHAESSGRNDLIVPGPDGERKVSGSAYRETRDRAFHHGTFLRHSDLERLGSYLTPHPKKLQSKGRASVRARVMNLSELNPLLEGEGSHGPFCQALIDSFFSHYGDRCAVETLDPESLGAQSGLSETYDRFASWDWRFGHAPQFQIEFTEYLSWGFIQLFLDSDQGQISRCRVFSDALYPDLIDDLQAQLIGQPFSRIGIRQAVGATLALHPTRGTELQEFAAWLEREVEV